MDIQSLKMTPELIAAWNEIMAPIADDHHVKKLRNDVQLVLLLRIAVALEKIAEGRE